MPGFSASNQDVVFRPPFVFPMDIAIVHYHLNRGGVTQVISNHLRSLARTGACEQLGRIAVLHGGRRDGWPPEIPAALRPLAISLHKVPGLDYDSGRCHGSAQLASRLRACFKRAGLAPQATVLHVHNHSLGKNVSLPGALEELARDGYAQLLQIHDFAEDFRPETYRKLAGMLSPGSPAGLPSRLYPQSSHLHYAVLNRRDFRILQQSGVEPARLHLLPNPVCGPGRLPPRADARKKLAARFGVSTDARFLLYPVRGIRRKNLGEALLWAVLAGRAAHVGLTLPPRNPAEQPVYHRWKEFAAKLHLPCVFELGADSRLHYAESLAAADRILTTSVAEGFGMAFLESWLAGQPLIGRDLPEITADFLDCGVRFSGLHSKLLVPIEWVGRDDFLTTTEAAYCEALRWYDQPIPSRAELRRGIEKIFDGRHVDFGVLDSTLQQKVIRRATSRAGHRDVLLEPNPWIRGSLESQADQEVVTRHNARVIEQNYSLEVSGHRLLGIYRAVAASHRSGSVEPLPSGSSILEGFLSLQRFHPIRIEA